MLIHFLEMPSSLGFRKQHSAYFPPTLQTTPWSSLLIHPHYPYLLTVESYSICTPIPSPLILLVNNHWLIALIPLCMQTSLILNLKSRSISKLHTNIYVAAYLDKHFTLKFSVDISYLSWLNSYFFFLSNFHHLSFPQLMVLHSCCSSGQKLGVILDSSLFPQTPSTISQKFCWTFSSISRISTYPILPPFSNLLSSLT